jgi:hypothetical protein
MVYAITQKRLRRAARAGGVKTRSGLFGPRGGKADWQISRDHLGWLTIVRPAEGHANQERIIEHADWAGPVKLMAGREGTVQRIDVFLGDQLAEWFDPDLHPGAEEDLHRVLSGVLGRADAIFCQNRAVLDDWEPPEATRLSAWLAQAGPSVARDKDENLRMTIRASNRDGQVRVLARRGQLRLVMSLGRWSQLTASAEAAMLKLADQANNHLRLARLAWRTTAEGGGSCEAQVDLTGLLWADTSNPAQCGIMRDMLQMAIDGLELALRQLQYELEVLADPQHSDLAETVFFDSVQ